jgi:antiviral defense system Shedu protein SduA
MNLLYTAVGNFQTLEAQSYAAEWRARYHIVEQMPFERVVAYLRFDPASTLALVDAIVCMADMDRIIFNADTNFHTLDYPLQKALALADDVRSLPENCTMRDGRKWRSIPFIIFCSPINFGAVQLGRKQTHAHIYMADDSMLSINQVQKIVDEYGDRVLEDYSNLGILIRFKRGRAQIGPALKRKDPHAESEYYYASGDRRNNKDWVTVKRDYEGIQQDVELFQILLDKGASETEMHRFFEEHPAILMQARMGIPISHGPNFDRPKNNKPDFAFSPILGPRSEKMVELLELKGPMEKTLTRGFHPGFTAKVHHAIDQVRDYDRYLHDPANIPAIFQSLGYIPDYSNLAVLIGRAPRNDAEIEALTQRRGETGVSLVTYDEILETQANQLRGPYTLRFGTPGYPISRLLSEE